MPNVQDEPRPLGAVGSSVWLGSFFIRWKWVHEIADETITWMRKMMIETLLNLRGNFGFGTLGLGLESDGEVMNRLG